MVAANVATHPWVADSDRQARFGVAAVMPPDLPAIHDYAQTVEGLGFDSLWIPDHPMVTANATWTVLAATAAATSTIRLGPLVACASYWNPVALARAAADLDNLSGGRFVLGLGSGDFPSEHAQMGIDWQPAKKRQARLEEALRIIRPLLRGETVTYRGEEFQANEAVLFPPPVQQPFVPILVAGGGEKTTLRYVAEYGDVSNLGAVGWAGGACTADDTRHKFDVLRRHCERVGRPFDSVLRTGLLTVVLADSPAAVEAKVAKVPPPYFPFFDRLMVTGTPDEIVPRVKALLDAGFQYLNFITVSPFDTESAQLLAEQVIPAVTPVTAA